MKEEEMEFPNICCKSCAIIIEKELARVDGVKDAFVEYDEQGRVAKLSIKYDEGKVDTKQIEEKARIVISRFEE